VLVWIDEIYLYMYLHRALKQQTDLSLPGFGPLTAQTVVIILINPNLPRGSLTQHNPGQNVLIT